MTPEAALAAISTAVDRASSVPTIEESGAKRRPLVEERWADSVDAAMKHRRTITYLNPIESAGWAAVAALADEWVAR